MDWKALFSICWLLPFAYILGSIPTAVWVGKVFHRIDVREHGSGNAGATNVMRVLGVKTGVPVLLFDMFKGWFAVYLLHFQSGLAEETESWIIFSIILGMIAVIGHIYPVFAGFRGGKGVATIAGVCLAIHPWAMLSAFGVFVVVLLLWKYVSLASILAGLSFPIWMIFVYQSIFKGLWIYSIVASLLMVYTHRSNIMRLRKGEENKATFLFKNR